MKHTFAKVFLGGYIGFFTGFTLGSNDNPLYAAAICAMLLTVAYFGYLAKETQ